MQQLATSAQPPSSRSFAGVLSDLAAPPKKPPARDPDGLEDDVAIFSYEQALRARSHITPQPTAGDVSPQQIRTDAPVQKEGRSEPKSRRATSVTIRLTAHESEQLHLRATETGLTVSAYLRSCAFEVENLRAEVKSTLAQLRSTTELKAESGEIRPAKRDPWLRPWSRLFGGKGRA